MNNFENNTNDILANPLFSVMMYREDINVCQEDVILSLYELMPGRRGQVVKTGRPLAINDDAFDFSHLQRWESAATPLQGPSFLLRRPPSSKLNVANLQTRRVEQRWQSRLARWGFNYTDQTAAAAVMSSTHTLQLPLFLFERVGTSAD